MNKGNVITITKRAIERIKYILELRKKPSIGVKVSIETKGCSGLKYKIEYADNVGNFDEKIEHEGVVVIIDKMSVMRLIGTEMDYIETQEKAGFVFNNPNQKGTCGCGESFYV